MPRQRLTEALSALHQQLESSEQIEADEREALVQAMREIQEALERTRTETEAPEGDSLSGRVTALVEDFETSHPKLAEILSSVSETLANLGI
jgi:hypothetical protein